MVAMAKCRASVSWLRTFIWKKRGQNHDKYVFERFYTYLQYYGEFYL